MQGPSTHIPIRCHFSTQGEGRGQLDTEEQRQVGRRSRPRHVATRLHSKETRPDVRLKETWASDQGLGGSVDLEHPPIATYRKAR